MAEDIVTVIEIGIWMCQQCYAENRIDAIGNLEEGQPLECERCKSAAKVGGITQHC